MRHLSGDRLPPGGCRSSPDPVPSSRLSADLARHTGQRINSAPPRLRKLPPSHGRETGFRHLTVVLLVVALFLAWSPDVVAADSLRCRIGHKQSPIDIVTAVKADLPALDFRYRAEPLRFANDGHTLRVRLANDSRLWIGADAYRLEQVHFHTPGGDRIAGEEFPLSAHLLHRSDAGQLLGVVVLFRRGAGNPALAALWPRIPQRADGDHRSSDTIDATRLLPADRSYYRYDGSLTASPCTEGVVWLVMKQPLEVSSEQLAYWRARFADNMRGPQPTHGRIVQEGP